MRPVWLNIYDHAVVPFENDQITLTDALSTAATPLKRFMLAQTDKKAMAQIMTIGGARAMLPIRISRLWCPPMC